MDYGIPYMGSKRKLAKKIIDVIHAEQPNAIYFYDLFGGGGAVSFAALESGCFERVVYNELNLGVANLLRHLQTSGVTEDMRTWISRELFHRHKNDDDYFGGYVKTCWSFGNNQRDYLYGRHIEQIKKEDHELFLAGGKPKIQPAHVGRVHTLQNLQNLQNLEIFSEPYDKAATDTQAGQTVIYCDPPYQNAAGYPTGVFDHDAFFAWCKNSKYVVYVSEYNAPLDVVAEWPKTSTLSATNNHKKTIEKLYRNR